MARRLVEVVAWLPPGCCQNTLDTLVVVVRRRLVPALHPLVGKEQDLLCLEVGTDWVLLALPMFQWAETGWPGVASVQSGPGSIAVAGLPIPGIMAEVHFA